jgi:two-component system, OmpR family, response regulator CpxR
LPGFVKPTGQIFPDGESKMDEQPERILVIDDDRELCSLLTEYLKPEGFIVDSSYTSQDGMEMATQGKYDLVILDVMLPGKLTGFNVLQTIRLKTVTPVLMLSARGEDVDRIIGLEMGADDYLPKPFNPRELLARIRTILRRSQANLDIVNGSAKSIQYKVGDVELDAGSRMVRCANTPIELTSVEFSLLEILLKNAGQVITRDALSTEILGRKLSPYDRSIDVHISKLRKKLGLHNSGNERIKSVRGSGYIYTTCASANGINNGNQRYSENDNP